MAAGDPARVTACGTGVAWFEKSAGGSPAATQGSSHQATLCLQHAHAVRTNINLSRELFPAEQIDKLSGQIHALR